MRVISIFILAIVLASSAFAQRDGGRQPEKADKPMEAQVKAVEMGTFDIRIVDKSTGEVVPARVLIRDENGNSYKPADSVPAWTLGDKWFMCPGEYKISVPALELTLREEGGNGEAQTYP